ncbi:MAG: ubiquinone/menaquinone biosynthesis methyltransferase [Chloroflexota bacterium]
MSTGPSQEVVPAGVPGQTKAERVQAMFARIVPRYDAMNTIMTGGLHRRWRRAAAGLAEPRGAVALDVGSGTGDLALALARAGARRVIGVDFCAEMLSVARAKAKAAALDSTVSFAVGDALRLPFPDRSFDRVVNGFLLRNVADLPGALAEMARVLKPGGRLVCLEITHPPAAVAPFARLYFGLVVPLLGAAITGEADAYRYLPASLAPLPNVQRLARMLTDAGFVDVRAQRLGFGTVALHQGLRSPRSPDSERPAGTPLASPRSSDEYV